MANNGVIRQDVKARRAKAAALHAKETLDIRTATYMNNPIAFKVLIEGKVRLFTAISKLGQLAGLSGLNKLELDSIEFILPRICRLNIQRYGAPDHEYAMRNEMLDLIDSADKSVSRLKQSMSMVEL